MTSQALAIKPPSTPSPGDQRHLSRRAHGGLQVVPATNGGVDSQPVGQLTAHWKLSPAGRLVASWSF
jgi:hypothetical protein